jgi:hypothetical protein
MTGDHRVTNFVVPGSGIPLKIKRTPDGRLVQLSGGGRTYVASPEPGSCSFDSGFVRTEQTELPGGLLRRVRTDAASWLETYRWDSMGQLIEIDGVQIRYDSDGRVVSCIGPDAPWHYGYSGPHLSTIGTPDGIRRILRGQDGRALGYSGNGRDGQFRYDAGGRRLPERRPERGWNFDHLGRLWTRTDATGDVRTTYLWDGWHCLGMIAGELGEPLEAVYSLDPTGTPVRLITRREMRRIPRDAYGESLLGVPSIPGLFGGAIANGFVHLPQRRLDPLTGSFDSPDPFNGEKNDPRRMFGWEGPLKIELPAAGPYTVCRNNPVSLADPTGAISDLWWVIPSSLTWSLQHTVGSLLGLFLGIDFTPIGWILGAAVGGRPFDIEFVSGTNFDCFTTRADGFLSRVVNDPNAVTYQFYMMQEGPSYRSLEDTRLFVPDDAFRPTLYGSLLLFTGNDNGKSFVAHGQRKVPHGTPVLDWSRAGGDAEACFPGSFVPFFPKGGMHFGTVQAGVKAQSAKVSEIVPAAVTLFGTVTTRSGLIGSAKSLGLNINDLIALTDSAGVMEIARILTVHENSDGTSLTVDDSGNRLTTPPISLDGLTGPAGTEALTPVASNPAILNASGSSGDYHPGITVLRLNRGATAVHFAKVTALEASLAVDLALPGTLGKVTVRTASAPGSFNATLDADSKKFKVVTGTLPTAGAVTVGPSGTDIPALVVSSDPATNLVTVDRDLSALGGANTNTNWRTLAPVASVGSGTVVAGTTLTYVPDTVGTAPSSGFVWLDGSAIAVRRVISQLYDGIVMSQARPDADPSAYTVDRFTLKAPNASGFTATLSQTLGLNATPPADVRAYQAIQLDNTTIATTTTASIAAALPLAGNTATLSIDPASPLSLQVGQVVIVTPATGTAVPATLTRLRLTITIDRILTLSASGLQAALLASDPLVYSAVWRNDRVLRVRPQVSGAQSDMPRFVVGDIVSVSFTSVSAGAGTKTRLALVTAVSGSTITYSNDEATMPADSVSVTVTRQIAADPGNGSSRIGINGTPPAANQLQFDVWQSSDFPSGRLLAIIDGNNVFAAKVITAAQPLAADIGASGLTGPVSFGKPTVANSGGVSVSFTSDGEVLNLNDGPLGVSSTGNVVVVIPFVDGVAKGNGKFDNGTVRVPRDHENVSLELDRKQAVTDHELTHTLQSLRYGPILLSYVPIGLLEFLTDLTDFDGPLMPNFSDGTLAKGVLTGAGLQDNTVTQVSQNGVVAAITLDAAVDGAYHLNDSAQRILAGRQIQDGAVQVRQNLQQSKWNDVFRIASNILEWGTIGGLLNLVSIAGWGGLISVIIHIVHWIQMARNKTVSATVGDDHKTLTLANALDGLSESSSVSVKSGDTTVIRALASLEGTTAVVKEEMSATGTVQVGVFTPGAALFGSVRDYFPGTIPDTSHPNTIKISGVGNSTIDLAAHDRIQIRSNKGATFETQVLAVAVDTVEVEEPVLTHADGANDFLVAKIGSEDPAAWSNEYLLDSLNIGFMKYINDPARLLYAFQFQNKGLKISESVLRNVLGTHAWWILFLGYYWFDNAYQRSNAHRSHMEQEASHNSGDTYSPIGSLHSAPTVVGDVGRYWLTVNGGTRYNTAELIVGAQQDGPGVNVQQFATPQSAAAGNFTVPETFYNLTASGAFSSISSRGFVPAGPRLERSYGIQVAFSKPSGSPSAYTITGQVCGGVTGGDITNANDAQANNASIISFNPVINDVAVTVGSLPLAEGATLQLIPFQRAAVVPTPNSSRIYRTTLAEPKFVADFDGTDLVAQAAIGTDDAEVSRFHHFNTGTNAFDSGIGPIHLPADLDIAVRRFQVQVVNTLSFRATLDQNAAAISTALPGSTAFVLVPSHIAPVPFPTTVTGSTAPVTPGVNAVTTIPAEVKPFLRDGGALQFDFPADQPPEQDATVTLTVSVGPDAASAIPLTATLTLNPNFTLDVVGGGPFQVAKGASITLQSSDPTNLVSDTTVPDVTVTATNAQILVAVAATFAAASLVVVVHDAAKPQRFARRTLTVT